VSFVEAVEAQYEAGLAALGAETQVVARFDPRSPASNKLRMLELAGTHDFDVLLAIDTDTIVVGDVSRYADAGAVAIKPENRDPYPLGCWRELFRALGIPEPSRSTVMTSTAQITYPYFNSGVLFVPRAWCQPLLESWSKRVHDVLEIYAQRPEIVPPPERHWTNQLSLALAVIGEGIPVTPLPVAANLSTTVRVDPLFAHQVSPPFVLHYHNEMDAEGFIYRSRNRRLNPALDTFNRARADALGLAYSGLPDPPLVRRLLRQVEGRPWYQQGPVASLRRHPALAPARRQAKRLARGGAA
jgi:hypothetical protein